MKNCVFRCDNSLLTIYNNVNKSTISAFLLNNKKQATKVNSALRKHRIESIESMCNRIRYNTYRSSEQDKRTNHGIFY